MEQLTCAQQGGGEGASRSTRHCSGAVSAPYTSGQSRHREARWLAQVSAFLRLELLL